MKSPRIIGDLSRIKAYGFGYKSLWGWGLLGFMLAEGMAFVIFWGAYLYLMTQARRWPLDSPSPDLAYGALFTIVMLLSQIPNRALESAARRRDYQATLRWLIIMSLLGVLLMIIRGFELAHLNTRWDQDAYGSIVWALMVAHTAHIVTDLIDTIVLTVFFYTHPTPPERFSHADDNSGYWLFVVLLWLPTYLLIYWAPRWPP